MGITGNLAAKIRRRRALAYGRRVELCLGLLPYAVDPSRTAVDVGANIGLYVEALLALKAPVVAVEPHPGLARDLRNNYGARLKVIEAAAADTPGQIELRVPVGRGASRGTVAQDNHLSGADFQTLHVERIRLDDLDLGPVGFIKIDVEGFELEVLKGAQRIRAEHRPVVLLEAEERHRPGCVEAVCDLLSADGYHGFFLLDGRLRAVESFRPDDHQSPERAAAADAGDYRKYANNFLFVR